MWKKMTELVRNDWLTNWKIESELNMNGQTMKLILTKDLNMKVCAKLYWKISADREKFAQTFLQVCQKSLTFQRKKTVTGDETLIFQYDP
jgi:hypothetical protein